MYKTTQCKSLQNSCVEAYNKLASISYYANTTTTMVLVQHLGEVRTSLMTIPTVATDSAHTHSTNIGFTQVVKDDAHDVDIGRTCT